MSKRIIFIFSMFLLIIVSCYFGIYNSMEVVPIPTLGPSSGIERLFKESFQIQEGATPLTTPPPAPPIASSYVRTGGPLPDSDYVKNARDNVDLTYHDDLQKNGGNSFYNTQMGTQKVYDVNGNLIDVVSNGVQGNIVYYQPGSYKYGASTYVPYYEDSVFLSRSINAVVNTPAYVSTNKSGGFCNKYKTSPSQLEEKCNKINDETCAATTCCVLLGGQKCVSGNESGPTMKDNYSDFMIANKDFYYYNGKCYGNCPNTAQIATPSLPDKVPYMNT